MTSLDSVNLVFLGLNW